MVKKISVLAMAGILAWPTLTMAGGGTNVADLERKIEEMSKQLNDMRAAAGRPGRTK